MIDFSEISCKKIVIRKIMISDVENIRNVRFDAERKGWLSKTPSDPEVFKKWLNSEAINPTSLYLAILDSERNFIGTVRIISLNESLFEWGSWAMKKEVGPLFSLTSVYAVYKIALDLCNFKRSVFKVSTHNSGVIKFHLKCGATIVKLDSDSTYFNFEEDSIRQFLIRFESKFAPLFVIN